MEIVLEVPDKDVARVLELVRGIKRVKIKSPKPVRKATNQQFLAELAEAVEEVNKITRGEAVGRPWQEVFEELQAEAATENMPGMPSKA